MKKQILTTILVIIFFSVTVYATEHLISLQGYASDSSDNPLSTGDISVRIYDDASGGSLVYDSGDDFNDTIADGIYDILLGSNTPLDLDNTMKYHMEIDINGGEVVGNDTDGRQAFWPGGGDHSLPTGIIVMWSGDLASIPQGWALCDGTQGTPDLRDRFIYGVSTGEDPGATGGSTTHSHSYSDLPQHTHSATSDAAGAHSHTYSTWFGHGIRSSGTSSPFDYVLYQDKNMLTTEAGSHSHTITINNAGQASCSTDGVSTLPPYYKLAFIMKL